jgi:hypothetical protein
MTNARTQRRAPYLEQAQPLHSHHGAKQGRWFEVELCVCVRARAGHIAAEQYLLQPEGAIICVKTAWAAEGGGTSAAI